jgi:hypothetical protein
MPDFYSRKIPKRENYSRRGTGKYTKMTKKYTKTGTIYIPNGFAFIIYQHFSFKGPPKHVYENLDFWYANILSGNPAGNCAT